MGTGDADCRVASLLAMTVLILCHSEEAQRADVGIRPFYDGRGFGPPHERRGERHAESSCPTESPINHPSQPARNEASAPAAARDGRESTQGPSQKGGPPPRLPGQRLAKRKARKEKLVKFSLCPMTSECSTAYNVWKSQQSPARAHAEAASIEQNGLEPHPAARQGASRARNCAATSVFSFDGSTAVFFLPPQKENGGGKPQAFACIPSWSTGQHGGVWSPRPTGGEEAAHRGRRALRGDGRSGRLALRVVSLAMRQGDLV